MPGVGEPIPGVVYPPEAWLRRYLAAGELPEIGLADALIRAFALHARRTALHTPEGDVTYAELDARTDRLAAGFWRLGLQPLDRVLLQAGNCKETIYALIGCLKAGLIPVCTLPAHREREIAYLGCHVDARAEIVQDGDPNFDLVAFAQSMQARIPTLRHIISLRGAPREGVVRLEDLMETADVTAVRDFARDPFQAAIFQLSGGTTSIPKVIPRMSNDYLLNMQRTAEWMGFRPDDVMFMPMPMVHNACLVCFLGPTLLSGAAFAIPRDMTPAGWGEVFSRARPTFVGLIRVLLPRLEAMIDARLATIDSVRAFWSPDGARVVRETFGRPCYAMFGMSEGLNMYTRPEDSDDVIDGTVGRPISACDEVRLVEPGTEREVGFDEPGELTCRGPYTICGYYNAPDRNREAFTSDGFYRSGDVMIKRLVNGETIYAFAGRAKDVVSRGHEKVNCEELESAVAAHPAVADCAVVGMPDAKLGERICAYVVVKPGAPAPDVAALGEHLRGFGLAKFKWPERIELVEGLALTKVGKLDKAAMRADIARKLAEEGKSKASSAF